MPITSCRINHHTRTSSLPVPRVQGIVRSYLAILLYWQRVTHERSCTVVHGREWSWTLFRLLVHLLLHRPFPQVRISASRTFHLISFTAVGLLTLTLARGRTQSDVPLLSPHPTILPISYTLPPVADSPALPLCTSLCSRMAFSESYPLRLLMLATLALRSA